MYLTYRDRAVEGDAEGVLMAIDDFSVAFPMYKVGCEKGLILDALVRLSVPAGGVVVEIGSFVGYSAVRIARLLPPGAKLICIEGNADCVATMESVLSYSGLRDRVLIEQGLSNEVLKGMAQRYGRQADLLFEDHCKPCYLPDLKLAEAEGLVGPGTWLIADNVIYPGAPDLLSYLSASPSEESSDLKDYEGVVVYSAYEYESKWNPSIEADIEDGMAISVRLTNLDESKRNQAKETLNDFYLKVKEIGKRVEPL